MVHLFTIGDRDVLMVIFKLIYTTIWTIYKGLKKKGKKRTFKQVYDNHLLYTFKKIISREVTQSFKTKNDAQHDAS